jgi:hypothetical protein
MVQFNSLLIAFLVVFTFRSVFQLTLNRLNIAHLRKRGNEVPPVFQGSVDREKLGRISAYTADSSNFGTVVRVFDQALLLAILLSGFLPWLAETVGRWQLGFILRGLAFYTGSIPEPFGYGSLI